MDEKNKEARREYYRQYYLRTREKKLAEEAQYRQEHGGRSPYQDYYRANRELVVAKKRIWELENPEKVREYRLRTWSKRREKMKVYKQKWYREHPEIVAQATRRLAERNEQTLLSAAQHRQVWTQREIQFLLDHMDSPAPLLAKILSRSLRSIFSKKSDLRRRSRRLTSDQPGVS